MSINPQGFDEAELNRQIDGAVGNLSPDELERLAAGAPSEPTADETGRIRGKVIAIRGSDVFVEIGGRSEGFLPLDEFEPDHPPKLGQVLSLVPHGFDRDSGLMRMSMDAFGTEGDLDAVRVGDVIKAKVTGTNIGGLELRVHGVRGFMPISQVDLNRVEDLAPFINHWLECEVTEVNRRGKNLVLSRRRLLERQREVERQRVREELEIGQVRKGVVRRLTDFGAFVDIGGLEGLLHVSDLAYGRVGHPSEVLKEGQEIEVKILKIDAERDRVSLGLKQLTADPWQLAGANYSAGQTVHGRVVKLMNFGAFVEIEPGIEGLIPISEMSWTQRVNHPKDILNVNDPVRCAVLKVDAGARKISLSLKALSADPWTTVADRYQQNTAVSGAVTRTTNFGAFVQLEEGVEGLIHISELSDKRINRVTDVVQPGNVVQVRVLSVDPEARRIALSLKPVAAERPPEAADPAAAASAAGKPKKKKEKPLRGGLER